MARAVKVNEALDWDKAAQQCLTTILYELEQTAKSTTDAKTLASIAETVAEIVGGAMSFKRGRQVQPTGGGDDD